MRSPVQYLILFMKGLVMGAADVVPGVSGGTIAFVSGIYIELISSIKALNLRALSILGREGFVFPTVLSANDYGQVARQTPRSVIVVFNLFCPLCFSASHCANTRECCARPDFPQLYMLCWCNKLLRCFC